MILLCALCEELLRKHREATTELRDANRRIELAAEAELKGEEANAYERAYEEVRAIHVKCAEARTAFLLHLRTHSAERLR
jgi:hypothetical protein